MKYFERDEKRAKKDEKRAKNIGSFLSLFFSFLLVFSPCRFTIYLALPSKCRSVKKARKKWGKNERERERDSR
jgi:hypothetical protein